jgi:hypothetical protein
MPGTIPETACTFEDGRRLAIQSIREFAGEIPIFRIVEEGPADIFEEPGDTHR